MDENQAAAFFIGFFFVWAVIILLLIPSNKKKEPTGRLYYLIFEWWDNLWYLPNFDYDNNNNINNEGGKKMNYHSWNTPSYRDVWVQNYIKQTDGSYKLIVAKIDIFTNIENKHEWSWLMDQSAYGWKCPKPPAEPSMFISAGAEIDVQAILDEYNTNKITRDTYKSIEIEAKSTKSVEIDVDK